MLQASGDIAALSFLADEAASMHNATTEPLAIEVNALVKKYPRAPKPALAGISFRVSAGEIFGLLGPNGAGKTTTLRILTAQTYFTSGTVAVAGYDVRRHATSVKKNIAVVAQHPNLDKDLTPRENLLFHAAYFGVPRAVRKQRADQLLKQLGLEAWQDRNIHHFSGGMAQRLMIARALMTNPALIFLDEPTTGLDPQSRLFLWERIAEVNAQGVTVILTTHNMEEADRLCHRVGIIDHGQLIALDTPAALKNKAPSSSRMEITVAPCTQAQLQEFTHTLSRIPAIEQVECRDAEDGSLKEGKSLRLYTTLQEITEDILHVASQSDIKIRELRLAQSSLEDLFIHLTGKDLRS